MNGTYVSKKRVERDGYLIAFEGEQMTMDEAVKRGLVKPEAEKPAPKGAKAPAKEEKTTEE